MVTGDTVQLMLYWTIAEVPTPTVVYTNLVLYRTISAAAVYTVVEYRMEYSYYCRRVQYCTVVYLLQVILITSFYCTVPWLFPPGAANIEHVSLG